MLIPDELIEVVATVEGHPVRGIIDTGAKSNIISRELCENLNLKTNNKNPFVVLVTAGEEKLIPKATTTCAVQFGSGPAYACTFLVLDGFRHGMLFGLRFIRQIRTVISSIDDTISIGDYVCALPPDCMAKLQPLYCLYDLHEESENERENECEHDWDSGHENEHDNEDDNGLEHEHDNECKNVACGRHVRAEVRTTYGRIQQSLVGRTEPQMLPDGPQSLVLAVHENKSRDENQKSDKRWENGCVETKAVTLPVISDNLKTREPAGGTMARDDMAVSLTNAGSEKPAGDAMIWNDMTVSLKDAGLGVTPTPTGTSVEERTRFPFLNSSAQKKIPEGRFSKRDSGFPFTTDHRVEEFRKTYRPFQILHVRQRQQDSEVEKTAVPDKDVCAGAVDFILDAEEEESSLPGNSSRFS